MFTSNMQGCVPNKVLLVDLNWVKISLNEVRFKKYLLLNGWDDLCHLYAIEANCYFSLKKICTCISRQKFKLTTLMIQVHCSTRWAMRSWYTGTRSSVSFNVQHRDLKIVARHQLSAKLASWSKGDYWQVGAMKTEDDHCHFLLSPGEQRKFTGSPHLFAFTILHMQLLYGQSSLISLKSNL